MRRGHAFTNRTVYGQDIKDQRGLRDFPPFSDAELNSTNPEGLGNIIVDKFGRAYQKVRYVGNSTVAVSRGKLAAWSVSLDSATHGATACTTSDIITTLATADGANAAQGWTLGISSAAENGTTDLMAAIKEIYSSSGASAAYTAVVSQARRDILNGNTSAIYDGNQTKTQAGADGLYATGRDVCFIPPPFDVTMATAGAGPVYTTQATRSCGVFLGSVSNPSSSSANNVLVTGHDHCPEAEAGVAVQFRYTWIQIYGPGLVRMKASEACVANDTLICADVAATMGDGLVYPSSGPPSVLQLMASVGYSLVTDNTAAIRLVPTFICPGYRSMFGL